MKMQKYILMAKTALLVTFLTLATACVLDSHPVGPGNRSLDGGVGGAGGRAGTDGTGGVGGTTSPGNQATCETCATDGDCIDPDHRCVEMSYNGLPYPNDYTGFCLKIAFLLSEGPPPLYDCDTPYRTVLVDRSSLSGGPVESYCGIREDFTTCAAVRAHADARRCPGVGDNACPDGGFCDWVKTKSDSWQELCTYACDQASQCQGPGGEACSHGYCGW